MDILGISAYYHDSAAALVVDGRIVAAAQEERFTRNKHDPGFPAQAVDYCLRAGGITAGDLDYVGFYDKPFLKLDRMLETYLTYVPRGFRSFAKAMPSWLREKQFVPRAIKGALGNAVHARGAQGGGEVGVARAGVVCQQHAVPVIHTGAEHHGR